MTPGRLQLTTFLNNIKSLNFNKMKRIILAILVVLSIGIVSCSKQGVETTETEQIGKPVMFTISVNGSPETELYHIK